MKLNAGQTGFFRVQYPPPLWAALTRAAGLVTDGEPALPAIDLAGLLDDAWALNLAGQLPIHVFLNLTRWGHPQAHMPPLTSPPLCSDAPLPPAAALISDKALASCTACAAKGMSGGLHAV